MWGQSNKEETQQKKIGRCIPIPNPCFHADKHHWVLNNLNNIYSFFHSLEKKPTNTFQYVNFRFPHHPSPHETSPLCIISPSPQTRPWNLNLGNQLEPIKNIPAVWATLQLKIVKKDINVSFVCPEIASQLHFDVLRSLRNQLFGTIKRKDMKWTNHNINIDAYYPLW